MNTLQHSQQILLSVVVIQEDNSSLQLLVTPLLSLAGLVMLLWRFRLAANRFRFRLHRLANGLTERLTIAAKLLTIGFNSLAWGCL